MSVEVGVEALMAWSRAMKPGEPCQDRKVAALSRLLHVLRGSRAGVDASEVRRNMARRRRGARFFVSYLSRRPALHLLFWRCDLEKGERVSCRVRNRRSVRNAGGSEGFAGLYASG